MGYPTGENPRLFGITPPDSFIEASPEYNDRDTNDGPDVDVSIYWATAAYEMADRVGCGNSLSS